MYVFFADAKRLIGRKFDDATVQADMKHWPFDVINDATKPKIKVEYKGETKTFFPEEVSVFFFCKNFILLQRIVCAFILRLLHSRSLIPALL